VLGLVTFHARRRLREMYGGHGCLCVCLSLAVFAHYCTDPDVTWGNGSGCLLVVHCWVDLQSMHGFRCYNSIALNVKCPQVLVLAVCIIIMIHIGMFAVV